MRNKSYIQDLLLKVEATSQVTIQEIEGNRNYVNQQYLIDRLEYIRKTAEAALDRLQLEYDENS